MTETPEVAIVGAGPYGLSLAAHLTAMGVEHRIFGAPMLTWRTQMPKGMFLKSDGFGSNLDDPEHSFTFKASCAEAGIPYSDEGKPISLEQFCAYGLAFQQRFVPHLEPTLVTQLSAARDGALTLQLADGTSLRPRKVVLAVGVGHFPRMPEVLAALPKAFCSHSSAHTDLAHFDRRDVVVVGAGASALDLAALLQASGAHVRLVARKPSVQFHEGPSGKPRTLWQRLKQPKSGLGPSLRSLLYAEAPLLFHYFPEHTRLRIARNYLGPAGGWFMRDQVLGKVPMLLGQTVESARVADGRVHLQLGAADGSPTMIEADHVIAATGYEVDLRRLPFLDPALLARLATIDSTPVLSSHFETSMRGLHIVGPAAANSFGPVMRFTFGARFAARRLSAHLHRSAQRHASTASSRANATASTPG